MLAKPLLMIDVDGVISLFGFAPSAVPPGRFTQVDGQPHLLSATAGAHLLALAEHFELVWCTGWEEKANDYLPTLLGIPGPLPFLSFDRNPGKANGHWKLPAIDAFAGPDRPLAWIDDAFDHNCHTWAAERTRTAATLLVTTEPAIGLTDAHVKTLTDWRRAL